MTAETKKLKIGGMTCAGCESRIENKLYSTDGILIVKAKYSNGVASITYDTDVIALQEIKDIISGLDYAVIETDGGTDSITRNKWTDLLALLLILFVAYFVLSKLGVFEFANGFTTASQGMGLGMMFVIGLSSSLHCVAMCGGINMSQCINKTTPAKAPGSGAEEAAALMDKESANFDGAEEAAERSSDCAPVGGGGVSAAEGGEAVVSGAPETKKKKVDLRALRSSLLYNGGRVISYTAIGAIFGAFGGFIDISGTVRGIIMLAAAVFMVIMGLNMLDAFPWLHKITPRMPKVFARLIGKARGKGPFVVGLLNGLMPCGPLQAMQIYALTTGSAWMGALSMLLFSLGTVPLMFLIGALSSLLTKKFAKRIMAVGAALVILLGMVMFSNGATAVGIQLPDFLGGTGPVIESTVDADTNTQTVVMDLSGGYAAISVQKGIRVVWIIRASEGDINGCNERLHVAKLDVTVRAGDGAERAVAMGKDFQLVTGDTVITFDPETVGTVQYACWMNMQHGTIIIK